MQLNDVVGLIGIVVGVVLLIPLLIGAVFVIVVVANRAEPDPSGRRPGSVYAFATAFITLFVTLAATTSLVASLAQLIGSHHGARGSGMFRLASSVQAASLHPVGDAVARGSVLSGIIALVAAAVFAHHIRAAADASPDAGVTDAVARVRSSYVAAVAFVAVVLVVITAIVVTYDVFRMIAPGVFSPGHPGNRLIVLRSLLPAVWLGAGSVAILVTHLRHAPATFRLSRWTTFRAPAGDATE